MTDDEKRRPIPLSKRPEYAGLNWATPERQNAFVRRFGSEPVVIITLAGAN
jgi:hypothetical protein